jgi:toxin-antitoxin system PIN domain toxin
MIGLLDVNVLVALAWPNHVHHRVAIKWFLRHQADGWATSPTTESGFVRVSSNGQVMPTAVPPPVAIDMLDRFRRLDHHVFWVDDISLAGHPLVERARIATHHQVTGAHLLALARAREGRLVTLDRKMTRLLDPADKTTLCVIDFNQGPSN